MDLSEKKEGEQNALPLIFSKKKRNIINHQSLRNEQEKQKTVHIILTELYRFINVFIYHGRLWIKTNHVRQV